MNFGINSLGQYRHDPEYEKIIQELKQLGISPSGNKYTDKAKLNAIKQEVIEKIQERQKNKIQEELNVIPIESVEKAENAKLEELKTGAMTLGELNRLFFKI